MGSLHVLAIAPSDDVVAQLDSELRQAGFRPEIERVEEAATLAAQLKVQRFDLAVVAAQLPRFSAASALEVVQSSPQGDLPVVVMSEDLRWS